MKGKRVLDQHNTIHVNLTSQAALPPEKTQFISRYLYERKLGVDPPLC
jgi:hypothetical protein